MTVSALTSVAIALATAAVPLILAATAARAEPGSKADTLFRISDPVTHDNLTVFFVHGISSTDAVPLTLAEAMARGSVTVHETGQVNQLFVENTGSDAVFIQAGDIVKGGRQDRTLTVSLLLRPKSGKVPIDAFCVEHGRWAARGHEDVSKFASSDMLMPLKAARLAMMEVAPATPNSASPSGPLAAGAAGRPARSRLEDNYVASKQQRVWESVAESQRQLSAKLASPMAAPTSQSSLQLSLENEVLAKAKAATLTALLAEGRNNDDRLGAVIAINGKISSADVYPSHGLFVKMWPKLLEAAATQAIAEARAGTSAASTTKLTPDDAKAFLASTDQAKPQTEQLVGALSRATRQTATAVMNETTLSDGALLHRSYAAY